MSWAVIFLAAFLAACLLAGSATAGIRSYKDSRGIIRITNIAPAKPRQMEPPAKTAAIQAPETPEEVSILTNRTPWLLILTRLEPETDGFCS